MTDIGYLTALAAGAISFLSPCVLPLVPPYMVYLAGASITTLTDEAQSQAETQARTEARRRALLHALFFVIGFSCVFVALGASASTIGLLVRQYQQVLAVVAGVVIIIMGLHFLGVFRIATLYKEARFQAGEGGSVFGAWLMGLAFAFGWTPCIGPVLGAILALASARDSVAEGALMLAVYSAGLGIPFLLAAAFIGSFMKFLARFKKRLDTVEKVTGGLLVLTGVLFLTGGMERTAFWLLETFPVLGTLG
ncbi:MAG: cytochrome c biogenesis protein CcdA [Ahrensia sp.]|nr:cytochrome c biogenesis protein CcdA [Ahrensia sp.]